MATNYASTEHDGGKVYKLVDPGRLVKKKSVISVFCTVNFIIKKDSNNKISNPNTLLNLSMEILLFVDNTNGDIAETLKSKECEQREGQQT